MPYVTKGRDVSLWKMSAITEIAPPRSSWSYLVYIQFGLILLDISLYAWGILLSFLIVGSYLWCGFQAETWVSLVVLQGFEVLG